MCIKRFANPLPLRRFDVAYHHSIVYGPRVMNIAVTLHLPPDLAAAMEDAVQGGAYPSPEAVVEEALVAWQVRNTQLQAALAEGIQDLEAGRTVPFDLDRILAEGNHRSLPSA